MIIIIIKIGVDDGLTENVSSVDRWKRLYSRNALEKEVAEYKYSLDIQSKGERGVKDKA